MKSIELRITRNIKRTMRKNAISYKTLAVRTSHHEATLKRCLNQWSTQSLTLSDLDVIYQALEMTDDVSAYEEFTVLPDEVKKQICLLIRTLKVQ